MSIDIVARGLATVARNQSALNAANIVNLSPLTGGNVRRALARARTGTGRFVVNCIGDSTTAGIGAGSDGNAQGAFARAFPQRLAEALARLAAPAACDSVWGQKNLGAYPAYDPRVTLGQDWSGTGPVSVGHYSFKGTASGSTTLNFQPANPFDTLQIWWLRSGSQSAPTVTVDGNALAMTSSGANPGVNVATGSVARGMHMVALKPGASGAGSYVVGMEAWDGTTGQVCVRNMGWSGAMSGDWASTADYKAPLGALAAMPADLTLLCLGINDWTSNGAGGVSAYRANMQAMIGAIKSYGGDLWLVSPTASNPDFNANTAQPVQAAYLATIATLAAANGLALIDWNGRSGPYAAASALGLMADGRHGNALGYADKAQLVARAILAC